MGAPDATTIVQTAEIPSIPHVLQQILSLADNPRTSSTDLEKYVTQEPALVAQLLKWVNSAAYSLPQRVSSIAHSMILLGFSTVKSIASGMVLINTFDDISGLSKEYVNSIWKHTLTASAIMKIIARQEPSKKKDDLFLAAMIHDVGYMVLKQYYADKYDVLLKKSPFPTCQMEDEVLGINHAVIGAALLSTWKFPEDVIDLVSFHHNIEEYEGEKRDLFFLKIADDLAHEENLEAFFEQEEEDLDEIIREDLQIIGWTWQRLQNAKDDILESMQTIDGLFR